MPLIPLLGLILLIFGLVWGSLVWIVIGVVLLLAGGRPGVWAWPRLVVTTPS